MPISNAEWGIMRVVWAKKQTTSGEILTVLSQKTDWTVSTVKTMLKRLVDKGYLTTVKSGKSFIYSACLTEEDAQNEQADELFAKFLHSFSEKIRPNKRLDKRRLLSDSTLLI